MIVALYIICGLISFVIVSRAMYKKCIRDFPLTGGGPGDAWFSVFIGLIAGCLGFYFFVVAAIGFLLWLIKGLVLTGIEKK